MNSRSMRLGALAVLAAFGLLALMYWSNATARAAADAGGPRIAPGTECVLYFRGDAAGMAVQSYVGSPFNTPSFTGTLVSVDDNWLVLSKDKKQYHIARPGILMIQTSK